MVIFWLMFAWVESANLIWFTYLFSKNVSILYENFRKIKWSNVPDLARSALKGLRSMYILVFENYINKLFSKKEFSVFWENLMYFFVGCI